MYNKLVASSVKTKICTYSIKMYFACHYDALYASLIAWDMYKFIN